MWGTWNALVYSSPFRHRTVRPTNITLSRSQCTAANVFLECGHLLTGDFCSYEEETNKFSAVLAQKGCRGFRTTWNLLCSTAFISLSYVLGTQHTECSFYRRKRRWKRMGQWSYFLCSRQRDWSLLLCCPYFNSKGVVGSPYHRCIDLFVLRCSKLEIY